MTIKKTETEIQREILQYLAALPEVVAWRHDNAAPYRGGSRRPPKSQYIPGVSDIIGFFTGSGKLLAIEVKTPDGKVTDEQIDFLRRVNAAGGAGIIARSVQDVEDAILNNQGTVH